MCVCVCVCVHACDVYILMHLASDANDGARPPFKRSVSLKLYISIFNIYVCVRACVCVCVRVCDVLVLMHLASDANDGARPP